MDQYNSATSDYAEKSTVQSVKGGMCDNILSKFDVDLLSMVHDFVEAVDEAFEGLDLLHHVLVAL